MADLRVREPTRSRPDDNVQGVEAVEQLLVEGAHPDAIEQRHRARRDDPGGVLSGVPPGDEVGDRCLIGCAERMHLVLKEYESARMTAAHQVGPGDRGPEVVSTLTIADNHVVRLPRAGKRGDGAGDVHGAVSRRRDEDGNLGARGNVNVERQLTPVGPAYLCTGKVCHD
jgi:hypothetical protein